MSDLHVERPVVRSFKQKYVKEAAAHVRAGGHAVVWENDTRALLVFQKPSKENPDDFGAWAVYDMGKSRWRVHDRGTWKGLATTLVPRSCLWIVKRRSERDSVHPGPTRVLDLDCTSCAACCRDNEVFLERPDIERFEEAGRRDLMRPPFARRQDGRILLTLLPNKRCRHLRRDNRCGIYEIRPHACSEFPKGSECCLFAREDAFGISDGAAPQVEAS
ncbi:MAG: YkgJ family cysteine cluster protein [Labilithrix sp.]|nr:YkgJ family cysteine cluster protein [Labilithrix sp.]